MNKTVNKGNRFGLVVKIEASEILRAAQTYLNLVETLGRRKTVMPAVFNKVVEQVPLNHPAISHLGENSMSVSHALDTVSNWLERVAQRDPKLFQELMGRIKLKRATSKAKERSHV